jgi:hypothetical protein
MVNVPYCGPFQPAAPDWVPVHALVQSEWLRKGLAVSDDKIDADRASATAVKIGLGVVRPEPDISVRASYRLTSRLTSVGPAVAVDLRPEYPVRPAPEDP